MSFIKEYIGAILFLSPIIIVPTIVAVIMHRKMRDIDKSINKGDIFFIEGRHSEALKCYLKRYKYSSRLYGLSNPKTVKLSLQIAQTYMNLSQPTLAKVYALNAIDYHENILENDYKARKGFLITLEKIYSSISDKANIELSNCYLKMAEVYITTCEYSHAWVKYTAAIELLEKTNGDNTFLIAKTYYDLGKSYYIQLKYDEALTHFKKSLSIFIKNNQNLLNTAECYNFIGCIFAKKNILEDAIENFLKSLDIFFLIFGNDQSQYQQVYLNTKATFLSLGNSEDDFTLWIEGQLYKKSELYN